MVFLSYKLNLVSSLDDAQDRNLGSLGRGEVLP